MLSEYLNRKRVSYHNDNGHAQVNLHNIQLKPDYHADRIVKNKSSLR